MAVKAAVRPDRVRAVRRHPERAGEEWGGGILAVWVKPVQVLQVVSGLQTMGLGFSKSLGSMLGVCGLGRTT